MKKTTLFLYFLFLSPSAFANEHIYSSLQLGKADHDMPRFNNALSSKIKPLVIGINTAVLYGEEDLKFGYNANLNFMYDEQTASNSKTKFNAWSADIGPLISYHLTQDLNLYSKVGLSYTSSTYKIITINEDTELNGKSLGLTYGLGFNCTFSTDYFIGLEYKVNTSEFKSIDIDDNSFLFTIGIKM